MVFSFDFDTVPTATRVYKIERKTVWQTADNNNILVLMISGECIFRVNDKDYITKQGDLFFIPQMQEYTRRPKDDLPCTFVYFHFIANGNVDMSENKNAHKELFQLKTEIDNALLQNSQNLFPRLNKAYLSHHITPSEKDRTRIIEYTENALAEVHNNNIDSTVFISLYLYHILAILTHITITRLMSGYELKLEESVPPKLKKAIIYIRNNLSERITINDICEYCSISPQHLIRIFKAELKTTPTQYINMLKISRAKGLIQNVPSLTIKEVAYEVGFDNPHYFSRLFTQLSAATPSQFKARVMVPNDKFVNGIAVLR